MRSRCRRPPGSGKTAPASRWPGPETGAGRRGGGSWRLWSSSRSRASVRLFLSGAQPRSAQRVDDLEVVLELVGQLVLEKIDRVVGREATGFDALQRLE